MISLYIVARWALSAHRVSMIQNAIIVAYQTFEIQKIKIKNWIEANWEYCWDAQEMITLTKVVWFYLYHVRHKNHIFIFIWKIARKTENYETICIIGVLLKRNVEQERIFFDKIARQILIRLSLAYCIHFKYICFLLFPHFQQYV